MQVTKQTKENSDSDLERFCPKLIIIKKNKQISEEPAQKYNKSYLNDVTNFIKLNYKCPKGTVDDTNKCKPDSDSESSSSNNNHIESYSRVLQSKVPKKFGNQVYLVRMGSENENRTNIQGSLFVGSDINKLINKAITSSKDSGNLIIGRITKDAFYDEDLKKINDNDFEAPSSYLGQKISPVDIVIDTATGDTTYKRSKEDLDVETSKFENEKEWEKNSDQNYVLEKYRNFGYQTINNVLRNNYVTDKKDKKDISDTRIVYPKEIVDMAVKDATTISSAMQPSNERKTLKRVDGAAITATLFPVVGVTEELSKYFNIIKEKVGIYPKYTEIQNGEIPPPSENSWDEYLTSKLKNIEFTDPAFSSTSKSETGIKNDLLVSSSKLTPYGIPSLLEIDVPKGTRLVDMQERLGAGKGRYKTEKEVLLDKNTSYRIKSVKLDYDDNGIFARIKVVASQKEPHIKTNSSAIIVHMKEIKNILLDSAFDFIKQNYKCPKGTVDDSNKCDNIKNKENSNNIINNIAINKLITLENPNIENNIVFKDNEIIGQYIGENNNVDISQEIKNDMFKNFGKYDVAHNHPNNLNTVLTPSGDDIKLAMERGGKNYVVTKDYIYEYSFDNKNTDINIPDKWRYWSKDVKNRNLDRISSDINKKWTDISLNINYLNKKFPENKNFATKEQRTEIAHKALKTFAKKIGMNYNRLSISL